MDIDLDDVDLPTTKKKEMRDDSTEILDKYGNKFIAFLEEDSDHNSEVWSAFSDSRSSLPKKGDLVVYFPQGHLQYEQPPKEEVRTYDLQPQIICRVEHVQLMVANHLKQIKEADDDIFAINDDSIYANKDDDIYAKITLHPKPEVNSEEKELEQSDKIEDCIYDEDGGSATISTPSLFSKILDFADTRSSLSIPPKAAIEFFCLDKESMDLQNEVTAMDFHGNEWKFPLTRGGNWLLEWSEFARARNLQQGERVVFLREKDTKLRFGIRRGGAFGVPCGRGIDFFHSQRKDTKLRLVERNPLSEAAGAILKKSIFSVMNGSRGANPVDFVIPWQKYMKSISRPGFIGAKVHTQYRNSLKREPGVVTRMVDLDPTNWPNSKWKCLLVKWEQSSAEFRVSPWEIVFDDSLSPSTFNSSPKPKRLRTSQQDNLRPTKKQTRRSLRNTSKLKIIKIPHTKKHKDLLSDEAIRSENQKHVQEPGSIHCEADTTNHPDDIEKQTLAPQNSSSQLTLCPDLCSLKSFSESKSTTNYKELKISNCSVDDLWRHLKENHSYEYSEFDSCSFPSSTRLPTPITIKKLKITNCVDTKQVFTVLMDPNLSVESLEIDSCSSFSSMSTGGIPATLRQLKIREVCPQILFLCISSIVKTLFPYLSGSSINSSISENTPLAVDIRILENNKLQVWQGHLILYLGMKLFTRGKRKIQPK
ncbi:hypothetical protein QYF36_006737 [Acer negundo]|nr:hypothetical protein QYF36_006737 [Acer negundo]